jgi:hypothetical protein
MGVSDLCQHWEKGKECPSPSCYRKLEVEGATEAWGLSTYSQRNRESGLWEYSELGQLVHDLKYVTMDKATYEEKLVTTEKFVRYFAERMLGGPIDTLAVVPGNRVGSVSLPARLVNRLISERFAQQILEIEKVGSIRVMKSVPEDERFAEVQGKYCVSENPQKFTLQKILLIDDVFETGASLNEVSYIIQSTFPEAQLYVIALTYLRAPTFSS